MTCDYNAAVSRSQQTEVVRPRRCMVYSRPSLMKLSVNGTNIWASIHLLVVANIIRPHRNTMYIDAAYCYRWSSVVCHDCQPCKNGWTNQAAIWAVDLSGTKEACLNYPCVAAMRPFSQTTLTTCCHLLTMLKSWLKCGDPHFCNNM